MASQQNILKLLSALGGAASESYSQGNFQKVGGQPLLPKPQMSMPDNLSPYAPGNQGGGPMAAMGGMTPHWSSTDAPNSTVGQKRSEMHNSPSHPAAQLAQYLMTSNASPRAKLKRNGTDPGSFLRGGMA